jgi:hypothetical protein
LSETNDILFSLDEKGVRKRVKKLGYSNIGRQRNYVKGLK